MQSAEIIPNVNFEGPEKEQQLGMFLSILVAFNDRDVVQPPRTKTKINKNNLLSLGHVSARRSHQNVIWRNTKFALRRLHEM